MVDVGIVLANLFLFALRFLFVALVLSTLLFVGVVLLQTVFESDDVDPRREIKIAIVSGLVGSIAFAAVNPFITPVLFDSMVGLDIAPRPQPEFDLDYSSLTERNSNLYRVDYEQERSLYTLEVTNNYQKPIIDFVMVVGFGNCNIQTGLDPTRYSGEPVTGIVGRIDLRQGPEDMERCIEEIHISRLYAGETIEFYFVTDADPESTLMLGETSARQGEAVIAYDYVWTFNGREYPYSPDTPVSVEA